MVFVGLILATDLALSLSFTTLPHFFDTSVLDFSATNSMFVPFSA